MAQSENILASSRASRRAVENGKRSSFRLDDEAELVLPTDSKAELVLPTDSKVQDQPRAKTTMDISVPVKRAHFVLRRTALANNEKILDREILKEVIEENHRRWGGCLMLPVTVLFFVFYSAAFTLHEDVSTANLVAMPIKKYFDPDADQFTDGIATVSNVLTIEDVWRFLQVRYIPLIFNQQDSFGNPLVEGNSNTFFQYNQLIGKVKLELQRSTKVKCADKFSAHMWCYPMGTFSTDPFGVNVSSIPGGQAKYFDGPTPLVACPQEGFAVESCNSQRKLTRMQEDIASKMPTVDSTGKKTFAFYLHFNDTTQRQQDRVQYLRDRGWLDEQTNSVRLKAILSNYQLEVDRIINLVITFSFSRGGGVYGKIDIQPIGLNLFKLAALANDVLFGFMLIASTGFMCRELYKACRERKIKSHFTIVNCVTWLTCIMGWVNIGGLLLASWYRSDIAVAITKYKEDASQANAEGLFDIVSKTASYDSWFVLFVGYIHLLFMARCFISLQWQPRLAVVTETLAATSVDLFHFLIVMVLTFLAFAIAGMMMFGRRLQDFSTLGSAIATCFNIAMMSQYDWQNYSSQDFTTTAMWCWIYLILVVVLMLNMVVAIIMDVYQEVRTHTGDTMTIWAHILYIYRRLVFRAKWVTDKQLVDKVSQMPQAISLLELSEVFPDMHEYQLMYLCDACMNKAQVISRVGINPTYTTQMVAAIHLSLGEVLKDLDTMRQNGWMGKGMEVSNNEDRRAVKDILTSVAVQSHWMDLIQKSMTRINSSILGILPEEDSPNRWMTMRATTQRSMSNLKLSN